MTQSDAQRIGTAGENLFRTLLPEGWIVQALSPDFAEDFRIRPVRDNDVLPETFIVQVKSVAKLKLRGQDIKLQLDQKDLRFWTNPEYRDSLFLVVIDVGKRKGYWLFLREYRETHQKDWMGKKKPTVYIPLSHDLHEHSAFIAAVARAKEYTARATSIPFNRQIDDHFEKLRSQDPRFDFSYTQDRDGSLVTLHAKEEVPLRLSIKSRPKKILEQKATDLFRKGKLVSFKPGELEISGSRLFDRARLEGCQMQMTRRSKVAATVRLYSNELPLANLEFLPAILEGGPDELRLTTILDRSAFQIQTVFDGVSRHANFSMKFDFSQWHQRHVSQVPLLRSFVRFVQDLPKSTRLELYLHANGQSFNMGLTDAPISVNHKMQSVFDDLDALLAVSEAHKVDPQLDLSTGADFRDVRILHDLIRQGFHEKVVDDLLTFSTAPKPEKLNGALDGWNPSGNDVLFRSTFYFRVGDQVVSVSDLTARIDKVRVRNARKFKQAVAQGQVPNLQFQSMKGAKMTYRYAKDVPSMPANPAVPL